MCEILIDQMHSNAIDLKGFPCHKTNPGNDILTCATTEENANDCFGYKRMLENQENIDEVHPDVVGCFDELIK